MILGIALNICNLQKCCFTMIGQLTEMRKKTSSLHFIYFTLLWNAIKIVSLDPVKNLFHKKVVFMICLLKFLK